MNRLLAAFLAMLACLFAPVADAHVVVSFYSVPGSVLTGRSVHAFFTLTGTLDGNGQPVDENYGFSAATWSPAGFFRPVPQTMLIEKPDYIRRAHYHFRTTISDAAYHRIVQEVQLWWRDPGHLWEIDRRNCVTFVGVVAQMSGLKADFPAAMMRHPRAYLDHVAALNPQLEAQAK
jgi:hypothetical protein